MYTPHHHTHHFWGPNPGYKFWRCVAASRDGRPTLFRCLYSGGAGGFSPSGVSPQATQEIGNPGSHSWKASAFWGSKKGFPKT